MKLKIASYFLLLTMVCGCSVDKKSAIGNQYQFEHPSMGSLFQVVVYSTDSLEVSKVVFAAFQQLDSLNLILSDYIPHSELMKLSATSGTGKYVPVSYELSKVLRHSQYWHEWSGGVFDITVGPYTQLWRRAKRQGKLPEKEQVVEAKSSVGFDLVELDSIKGVLLRGDKMQLDVGGIAKGYAVDMIYDQLVEHGYSRCLVDGGGDIRMGDAPPQKNGWEVTLQNYLGSDSTVVTSNIAIATSGDFFRNLEIDGKKYSHIIDPFTGYGITASRAVTAMAMDCTTADVLASVFSIVGPDHATLNDNLPPGSHIGIYEKEGEEVVVYTIKSNKKPLTKNQ